MTAGTFAVSRRIWHHPEFAPSAFSEREAFLWLVSEASWKPRRVRAGDCVVDLDRGQLAASVRFIASAWKWTPARAQRFIFRMKKAEMIRVETDTGVSIITLCNYDEYQHVSQSTDTGPIQDRYRTDTNYKKDEIRKEGIEKEEGKPSSKKTIGERLSGEWFLPMEWGEWAVNEGLSEAQIRTQADTFKDYWISQPGAKGRKTDWQATWRNWIRKSKERGNGNGYSKANGGDNHNTAAQQIAFAARFARSPSIDSF
jgi:hypothetical protein